MTLSQFRPIRQWIADNPNPIFATYSQFEWFTRRHRKELVASGELIIRHGRAGTLVGPGIDAVLLNILRRESEASVADEAA